MYVALKFTEMIMTEPLLEYFRYITLLRKREHDIKHHTESMLKHS